jgi:hypothetical protein
MARKNTRHVRAATPAAPSPALPASAPPRGAGAPVGAPRRTAQSGAVRPGHCRAGGGREGPSGARSGEGRGTGGWGKRGETWCCSCHNAEYLGFVCDPPLLA